MRDTPELTSAADMLADLRGEIDRIDLDMHRLLMARGEIIDRLIAAKRAQGGGCAFRPDREAQMMRALVERHHGLLPLDAVEGIWRVIVSTFTYVQANYSVHADDSGGDAQMRDSARFHFGFTVPYVAHHGARAVIDAVAASRGDLGMLRAAGALEEGAWWMRLIGERAPKIIARLPFVERPDHPAGLPVFIVARLAADAASRDILLHAINLPHWTHAIPAVVSALEGEILASAPHAGGLSLMVAAPGRVEAARFAQELAAAGVADAIVEPIGSHAERYELSEARSGVFAPRS
ncbi:chorismate mutase [Methylocystis sp. JR02]|uniref:chorismate mutase n=1 Tax=Methylocystis sp. JR02 TaxID=3046284 RepID=UPI0024B91687|nr:chorismate mutase [Methylocystis sp. JR02]MDJ0448952.1 chorismate mutase [Methylocystis sp. JR02]